MTTAETSGDILSLALAFYRNPARYRDSLRARVAHGGDNFSLLRTAAGSNSVDQELREAALFAIEQAFFVRGATHYQIMGLSSEATGEQIKAHHRLLMRIFHPDRSEARKAWVDAYAGRVNEAYNGLRHAELRRAYDAALAGAQRQTAYSPQPCEQSEGTSSFSGFSNLKARAQLEDYLLLMTGRLPQLVLGSAAVLALLFVAWVYVADRPVSMVIQPLQDNTPVEMVMMEPERIPGADRIISQTPAQALEPVARQQPGRHDPRDQRKREVQSILARVHPRSVALDPRKIASRQVIWVPMEREVRRQEIQLLADREEEGRQAELIGGQKEEIRLPADREKERRQVGLTADQSAGSESAAETQRPVVRQRPGMSIADLQSLVGRFVDAYNRGDLESFMALFDPDARANKLTGKSAIREDYGHIFRNTERRNLAFKGIRWQTRRGAAYGNGGFRLRVQSRDGLGVKYYVGRIRFEVATKNGGVVITGLYHNAR